ncbi:lytic transglycosylase domain-containing protein [Oleisolibacter albus]|uniref:lytic transglycosylase domain-containing protein n=1 Tax=Oleisolibacter albus TaxID=2171757 RepID=UPI000DF3306D|nr:lytic transglycosylase domain-containing protein [Oleisolibacter albus]
MRRALAWALAPALALLSVGLPGPVRADEPAGGPMTACLAAIRTAEKDHRMPGRLLMAVGVTESGRDLEGRLTVWPWTVNAEGQGRYFADKQSAIAHVQALRKRGVRSIDVGCMQVNLHWHPRAFPDLETAFDPAANVAYAAAMLKDFHGDLRNWSRSVKFYHSRTPDKGDAYFDRVAANLRLVMLRRNDLADAPPPRKRRPTSIAAEGWRLPPTMQVVRPLG